MTFKFLFTLVVVIVGTAVSVALMFKDGWVNQAISFVVGTIATIPVANVLTGKGFRFGYYGLAKKPAE